MAFVEWVVAVDDKHGKVKILDNMYGEITGHNMYMHCENIEGDGPGQPTRRYAFQAGVIVGIRKAEAFMEDALTKARSGRDHESIVYEGVSRYS
ncbi:hypothetical protein [Streptomyces sp. 5-10]|uniref:hypothetical protein n=1 Tax=Streptomyces sp. 5-10 TaxID=878925 RepID=UPI00168B6324|nr:hypothetical protein [Streptomyces sp. 5-10]MBD3004582.1 hypothetical protein [Streptomyces sp. 5-10]